MTDLMAKTKKMFDEVNKPTKGGEKEYLLISDFGDSSVATDPGSIYPFFRIFKPVKPEKHRKLSKKYDSSFKYTEDSILDYPTIIQYKLEGTNNDEWMKYNRLISVHVARCQLSCWHCYDEECIRSTCIDCNLGNICDKKYRGEKKIKEGYFSAKFILEKFIEQREHDLKNGIQTNVLRITGGEPFLAPDFILEILTLIRSKGLDKQIFIWTETNLLPFIKNSDNPIISEDYLKKLSEFQNFCIHPCFHGLNEDEFMDITGNYIEDFTYLLNAFKRLIDNNLDIYPTFGSNISSLDEVEKFYLKISKIGKFLPLRFCLVEYNREYEPIARRERLNITYRDKKSQDTKINLNKWNNLLTANLNYEYGYEPRHLVPIKVTISPSTGKTSHLFHWPSSLDYQQSLLQAIALPIGARGKLKFGRQYLNHSFFEAYRTTNERSELNGVLWAISCNPANVEFEYAVPIRRLTDLYVEKYAEYFYIHFTAGNFFSTFSKIDLKGVQNQIKREFVGYLNPEPGKERSFAYLAGDIDVETISDMSDFRIEDLYKNLQDIKNRLGFEGKTRIKDFPIISIQNMDGLKNKKRFFVRSFQKPPLYLYRMKIGEDYNIPINYCQLLNETRIFTINGISMTGKTNIAPIPLIKEKPGRTDIDIKVEENNSLFYQIRLPATVKIPKFISIVLILISIVTPFILYFGKFISDANTMWTVVISFFVLGIERLWDLFNK